MHGKGPTTHPDLLIGIDGADDAGVFRIREDLLLIQTADFFTPIVDEAFDWGRIAAANALSDVYAMGGRPLTALQLIGWPRDRLSFDLLGDVVDGGLHVLDEAGCVLAGGHSIDDPEPKYGFAVTGTAAPDELITKAAASPGDSPVLTKPIGTGVIATAIKHGVCDDEIRDGAVATMAELNAEAAEAARVVGIVAGTDVTGFGLLGHLSEVATASGVTASIVAASVPLLAGASDLASAGHIPGGTRRNLAAVERTTDFGELGAPRLLLADAHTSGGLLRCAPQDRRDALLRELEQRGVGAWVIGSVHPPQQGPLIEVR